LLLLGEHERIGLSTSLILLFGIGEASQLLVPVGFQRIGHETIVGIHLHEERSAGYIYTRIGNPTIRALEDCVAELEEGAGAVATSSGMGAVTTACLALLARDEHVVSTASVYGPSRTLMENHLSRFGVLSSFVDTSDLEAVRSAL
jgi:O-acetylhomoserine/O-acetylserine sulfhydrylase-like pyridoxal-dependent enzyme